MNILKRVPISVVCFFLLVGSIAPVYANSLDADSILRQAQQQNMNFFRILKRYSGGIDLIDGNGNTAYCLALQRKDTDAMKFLAAHGANTMHRCVKKQEMEAQKAQAEQEKTTKSAKRNVKRKSRFVEDDSFFRMDNPYMWGGLGLATVAGAIAISSGGSSGSNSDNNDDNHNQETKPSGELSSLPASYFRTDEYLQGNFLNQIKAAEAYTHMFRVDENGNLFSKQADSDDPLKKVMVGVVDSGVYANADLAGKIVNKIDNNAYNDMSTVRGYVVGNGEEVYIIKTGSTYYIVSLEKDEGTTYVDYVAGLPETEVKNLVQQVYGIDLDKFTVMNAGNGANPGVLQSHIPNDPSTMNEQELLNNLVTFLHGLNHGTHVSGIIAGNKNDSGMHGVAFENAQIYAQSWDLEQPIYNNVKKMVDDGTRILNHSWGVGANDVYNASVTSKDFFVADDVFKAYTYAAKNGAVWIHATGNEHYEQPDYYVGMGRVDLSQEGYEPEKIDGKVIATPFLAVAALDGMPVAGAPAGKLASYSNWCGVAKDYCLAAPGSNVEATAGMREGNVILDGTSMATPVVSGSIALLSGYYPWLSTQKIAYLLLETANNEGEYANTEKYGKGALDLEAAVVTPVAGLGLASSESFDSITPVGASKLSLSTTMQNKIKESLPSTVTAFDGLNRPFQYNTENLVNTTHASNANLRNAVSRIGAGHTRKVIKDEKTGFQFMANDALDKGGRANLTSTEVSNETEAGITRFYYAQNSKYMTAENVLSSSSNPYLAMNEAYGAENTLKLSDNARLTFSLQTGENGLYERDYEQDNHSFTERSYALGSEYSFNMTDYLELATLGGLLFENDAMLGMNGTGAFKINDSTTYYMGLKAKLNLTPKLSVIAAYYRGYTQGSDATMLSVSDLETESFMLAGEYKFNQTDKFGVSLSSPMSVVKGRASLMYASGRDSYSDKIYMQKLTTSLRPEAKEYDLGFYYMGEPTEDISLTGKIQARFNADGEKGVTDYMGIIGTGVRF